MIERIKASELPSLEDLDVEVLLIDYGNYFEAWLGGYKGKGRSENHALNSLTKKVQSKTVYIKSHCCHKDIPLLRLLST